MIRLECIYFSIKSYQTNQESSESSLSCSGRCSPLQVLHIKILFRASWQIIHYFNQLQASLSGMQGSGGAAELLALFLVPFKVYITEQGMPGFEHPLQPPTSSVPEWSISSNGSHKALGWREVAMKEGKHGRWGRKRHYCIPSPFPKVLGLPV